MSAKQFFKSTAFKCIAVLVTIVIVCTVFLTLCNALFYVSDEERLARAISKLYGEEVEYTTETVDENVKVSQSKINSVYAITSEAHKGDYLLNVTGEGGYSGGTVTCWVIVGTENGEVTGVKKANIASNVGQSYISKIGAEDIDALIKKQENENFTAFETSGISTGASYSMGAVSNALNGAVAYIEGKYCAYVSPYAEYEFNTYIDAKGTKVTVEDDVVNYVVKTTNYMEPQSFTLNISVGADGKISSISVAGYGSTNAEYNDIVDENVAKFNGKDQAFFKSIVGNDASVTENGNYGNGGLTTGASHSTYHVMYACLFATANYDRALTDFGQGGNQ